MVAREGRKGFMSYYVRKTSGGWSIAKQIISNGKREQTAVPADTWHFLGIHKRMTLEEARQRVKQLNLEASADKWSAVRASNKHKELELLQSMYLPVEVTGKFQAWLISTFEADEGHRKKMLSHWHTTQRLIAAIALKPTDFNSDKQKIFNWMRKQLFSLDYCKKLLRIVNLYGEFACEQYGQFYKPIARIPAIEAQRIRDSYLDGKDGGVSEPLTPVALESIREHLKPEQYRWLYLTVWLGLRPKEVDLLQHTKFGCKVVYDKAQKVQIISVYQPKLVSVKREQRWKQLPLFLQEQKVALTYIGQELRRPLNKTLKKLLSAKVTCYGGRKGFIDLMLDRGQALEDVSAWLGHSSIEMSWRRYRNKKRVSFTALKAG